MSPRVIGLTSANRKLTERQERVTRVCNASTHCIHSAHGPRRWASMSSKPTTFDGHMGLLVFLEDLLGHRVDVVTAKGLKPRLRPLIEQDLVRVA